MDFAAPVGIYLAGRTEITLGFIGAAVLFLPLFVFLPKLIQRAMKADVDVVIEAFGKNEQVKKVFWTFFIGMAGLVLVRVVDPATAQQIVGMITGMGVIFHFPPMQRYFFKTFLEIAVCLFPVVDFKNMNDQDVIMD